MFAALIRLFVGRKECFSLKIIVIIEDISSLFNSECSLGNLNVLVIYLLHTGKRMKVF